LDDTRVWEYLLVGEPAAQRTTPEEESEQFSAKFQKHLDMPASWVSEIKLRHCGKYQ